MGVHYVISWYDKHTNVLVGEAGVDCVPFADLQLLFALPVNEVMLYESQLINPQQAQTLLSWIPLSYDFDQYIYQLDCFPKMEISLESWPIFLGFITGTFVSWADQFIRKRLNTIHAWVWIKPSYPMTSNGRASTSVNWIWILYWQCRREGHVVAGLIIEYALLFSSRFINYDDLINRWGWHDRSGRYAGAGSAFAFRS